MIPEKLMSQYREICTKYPSLILCRVISQEKGRYCLSYENGELQAVLSGKFRYTAKSPLDYPAVGDYLLADFNEDDISVIHYLLPRKSVFLRKAAGTASVLQVVSANIDTLLLCMALNSDFNLRRLERYLPVGWESGATPVVVLTKSDLCDNLGQKLSLVRSAAIGVDIVVTSSTETDGYLALLPYLDPDKTVAFLGSSGVGKSSLINRLLGKNRLKTNDLRNDRKGRHTTTHRELFTLPNGSFVIDTPGMRELGLWNIGEGLETAFSDIDALSSRCRFKNCSHNSEPGCAIRAALQNGSLSKERWQSYKKLAAESAFTTDTESYLAAKEQKFKNIAKYNKANRKK